MKTTLAVVTLFLICISLSACKKTNTKTTQMEYSKYSFADFKGDFLDKQIDKIEIYYYSYAIQSNKPLIKEDLLRNSYSYKISINTHLESSEKIIDAFSDCSFDKSNRDSSESRLACIFYNIKNRKSLKVFFRYDLSEVEINNKRYGITEDFLYSILMYLPKGAYEYIDSVYQKDLKKP